MTVPDGSVVGTVLAVSCLGIIEGQVRGTSTSVGMLVPLMRSGTGNTLSGIRVEVRGLGVTHTLSKSGVEGESNGTALAFLSVVIPMGVVRTGSAGLGGLVPVSRLSTVDTDVATGKMGFISRTVAFVGSLVHDESSRADQTLLFVGVPESRSMAVNTMMVRINVRMVMRTITFHASFVESESSRASNALKSLRVPD